MSLKIDELATDDGNADADNTHVGADGDGDSDGSEGEVRKVVVKVMMVVI